MRKFHAIVQNITLIVALATMAGLVYLKKEPLALTIMLALSVGAVLYGRLFCGYLCPFHAFDKGVSATIGKTTKKRLPFPKGNTGMWASLPVAVLLLAIIVIKAATPYTKFKLAIPILVVAFVVLVLFERRVWHRYLCPFGLIMRCPSIKRLTVPVINPESCTRCKKCEKACPVNVITITKDYQGIAHSNCILCYTCEKICPHGAITITNI